MTMHGTITLLTFLHDGPIPLAVVSQEGIVTLVSQTFERATGLTAGERMPDWVGTADGTERSITLGGRHYTLWARTIKDGVLLVLRDRTDLKQAEDRIWDQQMHLAKVYAELSVRERVLGRLLERMQGQEATTSTMERRVQRDRRLRETARLLRRHVAPEQADTLAVSSADLKRHKSIVTVLFADIPAVEEQLAAMETEEFFDFLSEYRTDMARIVASHGGCVENVSLVRLKALFGDPIAGDDHAERAVRAALKLRGHLKEMQPRWFPAAHDVDLQVGLHTGYATVGIAGPPDATVYMAVGKTVTLARSLYEEARPGQIVASGRTYDAVREHFHMEPHQVTPRGAMRPIPAYIVRGEKTPTEPPKPLISAAAAAQAQRLGQYVVLEKLGEGGMATVYKGLDEGLNRFVALKVLSGAMAKDQKFVERLKREARGLAKLNSPYVAQIYTIGVDAEPPYFAMEFIEGRTLRDVIQRDGAIPARRSIEYLAQMAEGLLVAAEAGIIHRDIKPDNIMITTRGQAKLMDFGLVKRAGDESGVTAHGIIIGTPRYMSPEQARCEEVDLRSDIYSLGATFFHMIVGQAPFDGDSALAIMRKHEVASLPPLSALPKQVTPAVYELIKKMMAKAKEERFQDYKSLLRAIDGC